VNVAHRAMPHLHATRWRVVSTFRANPMAPDIVRRNHVRTSGAGTRPLVFAHGFGCDQRMWRHVAPAFEATHRVVLFDYVGSGRADASAWRADRYDSLDGYARDLVDVLEALDLRDAIVVGHSVSGMIAALAAARAPGRIGAIAMIGPSPRYLDDLPDYRGGFAKDDVDGLLAAMDHNYMGWASSLAPMVMGNGDRPELSSELADSFCSTDPVMARAFATATFLGDNRADLAAVAVPTLVIQCAEDLIAPDFVGEYVHAQVAGSRLVRLEATGHCPHMSHPDEVIAVLAGFLGVAATR
jgi:sigma-B regulation protein RsbQ